MTDIAVIVLLSILIVIVLLYIIYQFMENRKTEERLIDTQRFFDYLKLKPSAKGGLGESIVELLLNNLPEDSVFKQYAIPEIDARIDFCVKLPNSEFLLPIDSKFILPSEYDNIEEILSDDRAIGKLNKLVIKNAEDIERYSQASETTDFLLMFIPDFIHSLIDTKTYEELATLHVVPTNTSGLLSTIFMINMQHRFVKLNDSIRLFGDFQMGVSRGVKRIVDNMNTGSTQLNNCLKNISNAIIELENLKENVDDIELEEL